MAQPIQIEQTAKTYKAKMAIGISVLIVFWIAAMAVLFGGGSPSAAIATFIPGLLGAAYAISGKIQAWWHHG